MLNTEKIFTLVIDGKTSAEADDREDLICLLQEALRMGKKAFIRNNL